MSAPLTGEISPAPTDEEAVAIAAAVQAMWPRPIMVSDEVQARNTAWKFSGRWWSVPLPMRRDRPYR
ncbi:unannotated protein [freshwater metagenome]|uniref:Unannotated protein n=1 Tax=freshwater metagenome TaxID=449393 RepID=A0A6J7ELP5_9ZZZZ|nr:hypothetical protein [Actinomycetota bacterium]